LTPTQTPTTRVLDWEGCFNVRDLGGLVTQDGNRIRWGALVRSDIPTRLTEAGRAALVEHGVRTLVDLRFESEVAIDRHLYPFLDPADGQEDQPRHQHVPFNIWDEHAPERVARYRAAQSRTEMNRLDLDMNVRGIVAAVAAVADASSGGVLVHCHAGKDRTGIVVAMILSALGVSDDDIADDYAMTTLNLEPLIIDWLNETTSDEAERSRLRELARPAREAMLDTLAYLREGHGSAAAFLLNGGLTSQQLAALRSRLLDEEAP
jgi:protein-tyrosine phosphatase